jgi:hypothetical protein
METHMKWILGVLLVTLAVTANGCGKACDAVSKPGIAVTIVDGAAGSLIEGEVTVIASEGSYSDTVSLPVFPSASRFAALAYERPGTYRLEVQAAGYLPWVMSSVRVSSDDCHVVPVELTARLTKAGAG